MNPLEEQDVLDKIIDAQKNPYKYRSRDRPSMLGSSGTALIHFPDHLKLPDMLLNVIRSEKASYFGAEDVIVAHLWLETPQGQAYVPVAVYSDNPEALSYWKKYYEGTPASHNIQLVKKDNLQVCLHGNTLFASWTEQIPLLSPFTLPPMSLMLEAHGELKTGTFSQTVPSGIKSTFEFNGYPALATFMLTATNYQGAGTEGWLNRDVFCESVLP